MGVLTYDVEVASAIPSAKMYKALILDGDNLIPKILPQAVKSIETIEGNEGPGTIKKITFGEASQYKTIKHQVDGIDKENLTYNYSVIEGDALGNILEKISYEMKIVAGSDGGCVFKSSSKYYTIGDVEIKEEHIKNEKEMALVVFKAVEGYLLANPDAY